MDLKQLFRNMEFLEGRDPNSREPDSYSEKVRQRILKRNAEPFFARITQILFISMLVLTAAMGLVEIVNYAQYPQLGWLRFFSNLSVTTLIIWAIYAVPLVLCCCLGIYRNCSGYRKRQRQMDRAVETPEDLRRRRRALNRLNRTYYLYLITCFAGVLILLVFYETIRCWN